MPVHSRHSKVLAVLASSAVLVAVGVGCFLHFTAGTKVPARERPPLNYKPRIPIETSGLLDVFTNIPIWRPDATLEEYAEAYEAAIPRGLATVERYLRTGEHPPDAALMTRATLLNARGDPALAYQALNEMEAEIKDTPQEEFAQYTIVYYKGVTALRLGENDNCVMCRGDSSCIFPISPSAVHTNTKGSRLAVQHFTEYLRLFPDDLEVKWLLNLAHMTLGEYPSKVDPKHLLVLDKWEKGEFDIGKFRDVGQRVGLERLNQSGGGVMDDFDNDGLLDLVVTSWAPSEAMGFFRNKGDGTFENRTKAARLDRQMGGLFCVQTDYDNDGHLDLFIPRGSWLPRELWQRPSLLRNNGNGTFTDVTAKAGLLAPTNSTSATWADYDNDGYLDLFVCDQQRTCKLYRNKGDGTFEEVAARAGLPADLSKCLGANWLDFDNDGYPDLFVNIALGAAWTGGTMEAAVDSRLYRNNRNGTFTDVTKKVGINGPVNGFSCWAFDFDNDGWIDIFASTFCHELGDVVKGLLDLPHKQPTAKLYRNLRGERFEDVTLKYGLDKVYSPMGSNFGDVDNDGYLDFYLATGDPGISTLIPNRLFKNVGGQRFSEITATSRTGHLQKGHSVSFGDWDRNGTVDLHVELGGAIHGDRYHNVLFQNPGQGNHWLSIKLVGQKTNRAALGARIKVVTAGEQPLTVCRHVSTGSSFGANPLEQHLGLGKATRVASLEITWPTSNTTQVFRDLDVNQHLVVTEFAKDYQKRTLKPIALPSE